MCLSKVSRDGTAYYLLPHLTEAGQVRLIKSTSLHESMPIADMSGDDNDDKGFITDSGITDNGDDSADESAATES